MPVFFVLTMVLRIYYAAARIFFPKLRLFNLAGRISGNIRKNNLAGSLVAGKSLTKGIDVIFR